MNRLILALSLGTTSVIAAVTPTKSSTSTGISKAQIITPRGCPPVTVTTRTILISTSTYPASPSPTVTETYTPTFYVYASISTIYQTETVYRSTSTRTTTDTAVSTVWAPYRSTVTAATPPSFTPVLCQSEYYNPVTTVTSTVPGRVVTYTNLVEAPTTTLTSDFSYFLKTRTVTKSRTTELVIVSTVTKTTTVTRGTRTKNSACATSNKNLSNRDTFGDPIVNYEIYYDGSSKPQTTYTAVFASDAVDCCELCLASSNCTGSGFSISEVDNVKNNQCLLFSKLDGNCNAQKGYGEVVVEQFPIGGGPNMTISNGRCGLTAFRTIYELGIF